MDFYGFWERSSIQSTELLCSCSEETFRMGGRKEEGVSPVYYGTGGGVDYIYLTVGHVHRHSGRLALIYMTGNLNSTKQDATKICRQSPPADDRYPCPSSSSPHSRKRHPFACGTWETFDFLFHRAATPLMGSIVLFGVVISSLSDMISHFFRLHEDTLQMITKRSSSCVV